MAIQAQTSNCKRGPQTKLMEPDRDLTRIFVIDEMGFENSEETQASSDK